MWWETNRRLEFPLESLVSCGNLEIWNVFFVPGPSALLEQAFLLLSAASPCVSACPFWPSSW